MLVAKNEQLESRNFVDGLNFTKDDPCIFVVYPAGAAGDLLISIIDKHYLQTGCEYYGIADNGRVHLYTTDYDKLDIDASYQFDEQFFFDLAKNLGNRNLNYSLLDQVIFGCHMYKDKQVEYILKTFPKAKVIRIMPQDRSGHDIMKAMAHKKLNPNSTLGKSVMYQPKINNERVLEIPFGSMFNQTNYLKQYNRIINFLNLTVDLSALIMYNIT